jgi:secreted trypsin-like serine protease
MGAAVAGAIVVVGGGQDSRGAPAAPTTTSSTAQGRPKPTTALPFNVKMTSQDIPVKGGGVRSGGCSGSLIAPDWIITAGHCFHDVDDVRTDGKPTNTITATVGKLKDSDPGGHTAVVIDVRQSPVNDIALARLSAPVPDAVPLTLSTTPPAAGQQLRFAGWGSLSSTVVAPSDHLKQGRFAVMTVKEATLEADSVVPRTVENSPCPIDSGAPYFTSEDDHTGILVAVESSGPPCPQPGLETISRVDVIADWIHQQIGG